MSLNLSSQNSFLWVKQRAILHLFIIYSFTYSFIHQTPSEQLPRARHCEGYKKSTQIQLASVQASVWVKAIFILVLTVIAKTISFKIR